MLRLRSLSMHTALMVVALTAVPTWAVVNVDFKVGTQTLDNPWTYEQTTRPRFELSMAGTPYDNDQIELGFAFGGSSVATIEDVVTVYDEYGMLQDTYEDRFRMYDLRLSLRAYLMPLSERDCIHPYVGAGLGYYWLVNDWTYTSLETYDYDGSEFWSETEGRTTVSHGLFPFVMAGVDVPLSDQAALLFEYQHDFQKTDDGLDYGGGIFTLGFRMTW